MKKLTGALVLSLSLLLISGCRSSSETRGTQDASTPSSAEAQPSPTGTSELHAGTDTAAGPQKPTLGAGGSESKQTPGTGSATSATLSDAERQAQENCVDKWAQDKKLDRYGNAEGTMYAGGSPLFNERTGESRDRLEYFYERQPEAKKACATASAPK